MPAPPVVYASVPRMPHGMEVATWGARAIGALVDTLIRLAILFVPAVIGAGIDEAANTTDDVWIVVGFVVGYFVGWVLYAPLMMGWRNGQTWGHQVAKVRVVRRNGTELGMGKAFVREVVVKALLIEGVGTFMLCGVGALLNYLWPLWDDRNETVHDKICETIVVKA